MIAYQPVVKGTDVPTGINDKIVLLVDGVLYTGRTVRAALDEQIDLGRPKAIHSRSSSTGATARSGPTSSGKTWRVSR